MAGRQSAHIGKNGQVDMSGSPALPGILKRKEEMEVREIKFHRGLTLVVPAMVKGVTTDAVIDTAAQVSIISETMYRRISQSVMPGSKVTLKCADGSCMVSTELPNVPFKVGGKQYHWTLFTAPIADEFILGLDFLKSVSGQINLENDSLTLKGEVIQATMRRNEDKRYAVSRVTLDRKVVVPPNSVVRTKTRMRAPSANVFMVHAAERDHKGALIPNLLFQAPSENQLFHVPVVLRNDSNKYVHLKRGHLVGRAEEIEEVVEPDPSVPDKSSTDKEPDSAFVRQVKPFPAHLQDLLERSSTHLTPEQKETLAEVLSEYEDIFSKDDMDLGTFSDVTHHIKTADAQPIRQKMRRTPLNFEAEERGHLEALMKAEVIEPSASEWASPPVLVRKKDGKVRYCIDFRQLNDVTVKDAYPLPNMDECLDIVGNTKFFSTLDMCQGYHQIEIAEEDRSKTAFLTRYGLYQYRRMPFRLCNAPATFQRAMALVLRGMSWEEVLAYLDDVILLGKSFEDALKTIINVFERFRKYNLKLKAKKCVLFQKEVLYLGKVVSDKGISPDPVSVQKVLNWPAPSSFKEVERFVGLVNYHRSHIKDFAELTEPLYALLKKGAVFHWSTECKSSFTRLKDALVTSPVLAFPKPDAGYFILDTDASDSSIGAELLQIQNGEERLVGFGSYTLAPAQRKYCTTKKELLAVVRFTRQFRHYLLGRQFYVRTDHGSLAWLMRFKLISGMLARWIEELSQYDMVVLHRKGIHHVNADARSRVPEEMPLCNCYEAGCKLEDLPCGGCTSCSRTQEQWSRFEEDVDDVVPLSVRQVDLTDRSCPVAETSQASQASSGVPDVVSDDSCDADTGWATKYSLDQIREHQLKDPDISKLLTWTESQYQPSQAELQLSGPAVKYFWSSESLLEVSDGVLRYRWADEITPRLLLVAPASLREELLGLSHDVKMAGHPGFDRTFFKLRQFAIWFGMRNDCEVYVKSCPTCSRQKKPQRHAKASLGSFHAGAPAERVHLDILGPFNKSSAGNVYILMLVCQFSKWIEAYPIPDQTTEQIASTIVRNFISRFGCPVQIHTDQGRNFDSDLFQAVCRLLEITKTRTTPYRPCSNGQVERYNRTLLQLIRCHLEGKVANWDVDLEILTGAIRALPNRTTGFTPNMIMFGREVRQPTDLMFGTFTSSESEPQYVRSLRDRMQRVHALAREKIQATQRYQKRYYDASLLQQSYEVGDVVLKLNKASKSGQPRKLQPSWIGPFLVTTVLSPVLLRIRDRRRNSVVHHDMLKLCNDRCLPMWLRRMRNRLLNLEEPEEIEDQDGDLGIDLLHSSDDQVNSGVDGVTCPSFDNSASADEDNQVWVQCEESGCRKWRYVPAEHLTDFTHQSWYCRFNPDPRFRSCETPEQDDSTWKAALERKGLSYTVADTARRTSRRGRPVKQPARFM